MTWTNQNAAAIHADWAVLNASGTVTRSVVGGRYTMLTSDGNAVLRPVALAIGSSTPWYRTAKISGFAPGDYAGFGFGVRDVVTGKMTVQMLQSIGGQQSFVTYDFQDYTTGGIIPHGAIAVGGAVRLTPNYWRWHDNGTYLEFSWSEDGITWANTGAGGSGTGVGAGGTHAAPRTSFLANGPGELVLYVFGQTTAAYVEVEWVREGTDVSDPPAEVCPDARAPSGPSVFTAPSASARVLRPGDFLLDANGDRVVSAGDFVMVSGPADTRQSVGIRLRTIKGEWYLDTTVGFIDFAALFGKGAREVTIRARLLKEIEATPGILPRSAVIERMVLDAVARTLAVRWRARCFDGEGISDSTVIG